MISIADRYSGKKKEHKPKLWGPDIFWWGGGRNPGKTNFLAGYPGILPAYPGDAQKVGEKQACVKFLLQMQMSYRLRKESILHSFRLQ